MTPENLLIAKTWACFLFTYIGLALGRIPGLRLDRAGIALVGATLVIAAGVLPLDQAVQAVDFETIVLLFGMMVIVGSLRLSGFFETLGQWSRDRVHTPYQLLAATIVASGVLSAFLVNDVVCLAMTPLVIQLARRLNLDPVPQLIGVATASNIGSVATITGNPQNMIIGSLAHIPYLHFAARLGPLAILGLVINFVLIALVYRSRLASGINGRQVEEGAQSPGVRRAFGRPQRQLRVKSLLVVAGVIVLFFCGLNISLVALAGAAILLCSRVRPARIYQQVDWNLLVMFCGLFVVARAFEMHVVRGWHIDQWRPLLEHPVSLLSAASAGLSNLVSNVPAVLLLKPLVAAVPSSAQESAWLALAMSSTLAGNLTVLGSVANLIVVELARREGVSVSFGAYFAVGLPLTIVTLALGVGWLMLAPH